MISQKGKSINDIVSFFALLVAFICATNGELLYTDSVLLYYLPFAGCLFALVFELLMSKKTEFSSYFKWRIVLIVFFVFTMLYAIDYDDAFVIIKKYLLQTTVVFLIGVKCTQNRENLGRIIKICIFSGLLSLIYLYNTVDFASITEGNRLGASTVNESWNANNIGLVSAFCAVLIVFICFLNARKTGKLAKTIGIVLMIFFVLFAVLSGSRKSIIAILVALLLFFLQSSKSHKVRNLLLSTICLIVALYAIYNIPFLYDYVGYRFEGLLDMLFADGGDSSSLIRQRMISVGFDAFLQKPILGYGLNGFSNIYGSITGTAVYAHNNYIELLVNTGIVGFVLYYAYIFKMLFKKTVANKQTVFFKAVLISLLISEVGCVSYSDPFCQYVLCIIIHGILYSSDVTTNEKAK